MARPRKYDLPTGDYRAYRREYMKIYMTPERRYELSKRLRQKYIEDEEYRERKRMLARESYRKKKAMQAEP